MDRDPVAAGRRKYLTPDEAADVVGISPVTLESWRREGRGPSYFKVGRFVRYAATDLEGFMESHRVLTIDQERRRA